MVVAITIKMLLFCGLLSKQINKWRWAICICFNSEKVAILYLGEKKVCPSCPQEQKRKKRAVYYFFLGEHWSSSL